MLNFTPPPRQQVLYGIRIQAEQARMLVEDLLVGSDTAATDLMGVASQISARARMYQWPRLTIWASALEERLAKLSSGEQLDSSDLEWLSNHVERLESVLERPTGQEEEGEAVDPVFDMSEDSSEYFIDYTALGSNEKVKGGDGLDIEIDVEDVGSQIPFDHYSEEDTARSSNALDEKEAEKAPIHQLDEEEDRTSPSSFLPDIIKERQTPSAGVPAPVTEGAPETSSERPSETDDGKATLGRLEIQRKSRSETQSSTEIQGPNQYIVISVSADAEIPIWLGRMLPERRFELLAAKGAVEAELLCRNHQPDLVLLSWDSEAELAQQALARIRDNPLTRYVRVALVTKDDDLKGHLAASRLGAMGVVAQSAPQKTVFSRVLLCVLTPGELPHEEIGDTSMSELSELLLNELRVELDGISTIVGDVMVPVGGLFGQVLRETSRKLREGIKEALGCGFGTTEGPEAICDEDEVWGQNLVNGKRALVMEADRLRRVELTRVLGEIGLEVLPPMPDLTQALEAGLSWAPDVFIGGSPVRDSEMCVRILKRDIALSSMTSVVVRWPDTTRQWPDAQADADALRPWLTRQIIASFSPAAELEKRLAMQDEVTGRVESCGVLELLKLVFEHRNQALLEIGEGTDQFRAVVADGQIVDVIWTEVDGTTTLHFDAFARMLTVSRGRFFIRPLKGDIPELALPGSLTELLTAACHWWRPLGLTIDQRLMDIQPLVLEKRRTSEVKRQTGKLFRKVVSALAAGKTPSEIIINGGLGEDVVAHVLRELVRRYAVRELPTPRVSQA